MERKFSRDLVTATQNDGHHMAVTSYHHFKLFSSLQDELIYMASSKISINCPIIRRNKEKPDQALKNKECILSYVKADANKSFKVQIN